MSVNQVHLLGRCGQDPEIRSVGQNNVAKASFSLCTGGKYKSHDGREIDDTAWHNIVAWRGLATLAQQYIRKGSQIFLIGHLSYRKYTDANGIERFVTEIIADKIELCGGKAEATPPAQIEAQTPKSLSNPCPDDIGDLPPNDGMPFYRIQ
jgi:single-strand DNA-binding protein